jgi:hypothetical protein
MKKIVLLAILVSVFMVSCKNEVKVESAPEVVEPAEKTIVLTQYSDENWDKGVGKELNMFLVDLNDKNKELLKDVKELELVDGKIVKVSGVNIAEPFIQILIDGKASDYMGKASYPNEIYVK